MNFRPKTSLILSNWCLHRNESNSTNWLILNHLKLKKNKLSFLIKWRTADDFTGEIWLLKTLLFQICWPLRSFNGSDDANWLQPLNYFTCKSTSSFWSWHGGSHSQTFAQLTDPFLISETIEKSHRPRAHSFPLSLWRRSDRRSEAKITNMDENSDPRIDIVSDLFLGDLICSRVWLFI